jgi:C-terminal processing protease CtpA/Prc
MAWKYIGLVAIGIVAGFGVTSLVQQNDKSPLSGGAASGKVVPSESKDEAAQRTADALALADQEEQIAALTREIEAARSQAATVPRIELKVKTPAERAPRMQEDLNKLEDVRKQRETEQLLAAGFSKERIDWIRKRDEELQTKRRQAATDRQRMGLPAESVEASGPYFFDKDFDLRYEIGDEEYERYRVAAGRPAGVGVPRVQPGTLAESAGLKPGDEIIRYDGKRVFNYGELVPMTKKGAAGESVIVVIRRNGQTQQLVTSRGDMGLLWTIAVPNMPNLPGLPKVTP